MRKTWLFWTLVVVLGFGLFIAFVYILCVVLDLLFPGMAIWVVR